MLDLIYSRHNDIMSVLYRDLGVTPRRVDMKQSLAPPPAPPGPTSPLSEDFQVISENRLLASINMRHPEPRLPPSYHTLNSREVLTQSIFIIIMIKSIS